MTPGKGGIEVEKSDANVVKPTPLETPEVKAVATSLQNLHKLETQVTVDANKKNLDKLGVSLVTECTTKATEVVDMFSQGKKIEQIDADHLEWLDTFIGWNIIGTVHGKLLRDAKNANGTVDKAKYQELRKTTDISSVANLQKVLQTTGVEYSAGEQKVVKFLSENNDLAKTYIEKRFAHVVSTMDSFVLSSIDEYNGEVIKDPTKAIDKSTTPAATAPEKGFMGKAGDFVKEHQTALLVGGGAIVGIWALKKWFGGSHKKKGFSISKTLKWLGVGAGGYYVIHGLMTGKWDFKTLLDWDKEDALKKPEDQVKAYEKLDMESKEAYEGTGTSVDDLYKQVYGEELGSGWQDDADMETISQRATGGKEALKGVVPFCLDKDNSTVDKLFSETGQAMSFINETVEGIKDKTLGLITGTGNYLWTGFLSLFGGSGDPKKEFNKWFEGDKEKHAQEIKFFFREKVRVQTFLLQKQKQLVELIAREKVPAGSDVGECIDDKDWLEKNVYNDARYTSFRSGNIKNAYAILKTAGLMNGNIDDETKKIVKKLDDQRRDILGQKGTTDILQQGKQEIASGKIDSANVQKLSNVCTEIKKDLDEEFLEVLQNRPFDVWHNLFDGNVNAKKNFLEHSGINAVAEGIKKSLLEYNQKIVTGSITAQEYADFANIINQYFALKKEVYCGTDTVEYVHNADGSWVVKGMDFFWGQLHALGTACGVYPHGDSSRGAFFLSALPLEAGIGYGIYLCSRYGVAGGAGKFLLNTAAFAVSMPKRILTPGVWAVNRLGGKMYGPAWALRKRFFEGVGGPKQLLATLKNGQISLDKAVDIIENGTKGGMRGGSFSGDVRAAWSELNKGSNTKSNLLKDIFGIDIDESRIMEKYFDTPFFNKRLFSKGANIQELVDSMKSIDSVMISLDGNKKKLLESILQKKGLTTDAIKDIVSNIGKVNESLLKGADLDNLARGLLDHPGDLSSVSAIENRIQTVSRGALSATENIVSDARKDLSSLKGEQLVLRKNVITAVQKLDHNTTLLEAARTREIEVLKSFSTKIPEIADPKMAETLLNASDKIGLQYIAKMSEENANIREIFGAIEKDVKPTMSADDIVSTLKNILKNPEYRANGTLKAMEEGGFLRGYAEEVLRLKIVKINSARVESLAKATEECGEVLKSILRVVK